MLPDGRYDAFVVWAERHDDGLLHVELTVTTGEHKGDVVPVVGEFPRTDPIALTGMPCTLV
ncbi:MAG TPA: hypothetical protein VM618_10335, partial [Acidimicrobiia bacterium]|nr:hypothetical protein [Acidimicrobiia bacterium]